MRSLIPSLCLDPVRSAVSGLLSESAPPAALPKPFVERVAPPPYSSPVDAFPKFSAATMAFEPPSKRCHLPTVNNSVSKSDREAFASTLSPRIRTRLDQPFGKDTPRVCFHLVASLRLILLPLWKSGFLETSDWTILGTASPEAKLLLDVLADYGDVDANSLPSYAPDWESRTDVDQERVRLLSAAFLVMDGDMAALTRWIGGPHVGAHRNVPAILEFLDGIVDASTLSDLARIYRLGVPSTVNAVSTERNFRAYLRYGNHSSVVAAPDKTLSTIIKDHRKGYCLALDQRLVHFTLDCHVTPLGVVDLDHPFKLPRMIFDSSFRPEPSCHAINDWTSKETEPALYFADAFDETLVWLWNLRISYPHREIYLADDDAGGAFRHSKQNPNVVAMHAALVGGLLIFMTGQTFGDNYSPSNWEPIARARQQVARFLWVQSYTVATMQGLFSGVTLAPAPSLVEVASFARADSDALNTGVFDASGHRIPPLYRTHVDDCLYADVDEYMKITVAASLLALFVVLGFPLPFVPNPLSTDKTSTHYTHQRKSVGWFLDSRSMTVALPSYKVEQLIATLSEWTTMKDFLLIDAARLQGTLVSATRYNRWGRAWLFGIQNAFRRALRQRYYVVRRFYDRAGRLAHFSRQLPRNLQDRTEQLVSREQARLLYHSKTRTSVSAELQSCVRTLLNYLRSCDISWSSRIAFLVPRMPHFVSIGDASFYGGGAHVESLQYWFDIVWSPRVRSATQLPSSDPGFVHINSLEFIVVLLQLAASIERFRTLPDHLRQSVFPAGVPNWPLGLFKADNTVSVSWCNRVTTSSAHGQRLLPIYAELIRLEEVGDTTQHIAGSANDRADFLSRPESFDLCRSVRLHQIFQKHGSMRTWDFFLPDPALLQLIYSRLFSESAQDVPSLPKKLGRFVPADSTISCSPQI